MIKKGAYFVFLFCIILLSINTTSANSPINITNSSEDFIILNEQEINISVIELTEPQLNFFSKLFNLFNNVFSISGYATSCSGCVWNGKRYNAGQSIYDSVAKVCKTCKKKTCSWEKDTTATCDRTMTNRATNTPITPIEPEVRNGATCTEADGGAEPTKKATLTYCKPPKENCQSFTDNCKDANVIEEYYCKPITLKNGDKSFFVLSANAYCFKGCRDGACIK
jgi:hypothetical protein